MLSERSVPVIRRTLPAISAHIEKIAGQFYEGLFAAHPGLLRDLFNRGNQANGEQCTALAGSIAAYAGMLGNGTRADAILARIAHKHASLGIEPSQYKVVHTHLFAAIVEVLGDAVTPEVAAAWDEVYWLMADTLIAAEAKLGEEKGSWQKLTIAERYEETPDAVSFVLRDPQGTFLPGQFISVRVQLPDGARQIRQYSLSRGPARPDWRITVKRVHDPLRPDGEVSNWLHEHARPGDTLTVSAPYGTLTLPDGDAPLLLASAGIGTTPMLSMLDHLASTHSARPVTVVHADRSPASHAHRAELLRLVYHLPNATLHLFYDRYATLDSVDVPPTATALLCGPLPFLRTVRTELLDKGVASDAVHYELFSPDHWLAQP
ncbi:globin domain-containing protein [Streptomyces acidiscabies]|uniref:globin domain-containing protein n=1 Tax=Streptomyces acidiscabies TaxID=42234 RepID=UPI000951CA7B|nr:globin domain-containing protein [Streptomyces acidiscabies]GAV37521.1 flavohemoprotein [Streptomyces acidiscabies]